MTDKKRMKKILEILSKIYPDIKIQLDFSSPFELLIATILSAQCTDARVNIVTKDLFKKYHNPKDYLSVSNEELERDIFSTGFYKAKAKNIKGACKEIIEKFNENVPSNMNDLLTLPGVGRKTANVVLGHCFNIPGVVVDTHVSRFANRLEFINSLDAVKIEFKLMELIPKDKWVIFTHYIINHGRNTCKSQNPKCSECPIIQFCNFQYS